MTKNKRFQRQWCITQHSALHFPWFIPQLRSSSRCIRWVWAEHRGTKRCWGKQFHSNIPGLFSPLISEGATLRKPDAFFFWFFLEKVNAAVEGALTEPGGIAGQGFTLPQRRAWTWKTPPEPSVPQLIQFPPEECKAWEPPAWVPEQILPRQLFKTFCYPHLQP